MLKEFKPIKLKDNLYFSIPVVDWNCAFCREKIEKGQISFVMYNLKEMPVYKNDGNRSHNEIQKHGNGIRIHTSCIENFSNSLKQFRKKKIKEIVAGNLI